MLTTRQVAQKLGLSPARVRQLAQAHNLGTLLTPRQRIFTPAEAAKLGRIARKLRQGSAPAIGRWGAVSEMGRND